MQFAFEQSLKSRSAPSEAQLAEIAARSDALDDAKRELADIQKAMSAAMFRMFDEVEKLHKSHFGNFSTIAAWLKTECRLSDEDLLTYQRFGEALGQQRDLLDKTGITFETIKALVHADNVVRDDALRMIKAGHPVDANVVRSISKSRHREAMTVSERRYSEQQLLIRRKIYQKGRAIIVDFQNEARDLYRLITTQEVSQRALSDATKSTDNASIGVLPDENSIKTQIIDRAKRLQPRFEEIFAPKSAAVEDWLSVGLKDLAEQNVAEAKYALERLSSGWFSLDFPEEFQSDVYEWRIPDGIFHLTGLPFAASTSARPEANEKLTSLEICAGIGGEAIGLMAAEFETVSLIDNSADAIDTLQLNWPRWNAIKRDLRSKVAQKEILAFKGGIDLLAGGVPCQPFSRGGQRRGEFDDRELFTTAGHYVKELKPRAFFFENVKGFEERKHADFRRRLTVDFNSLGYDIELFTMKAAEYGLPQERERVVLLGLKKGYRGAFRLPSVNPTPKTFVDTIIDVLFPYRSNLDALEDDSFAVARSKQQKLYDDWVATWIFRYGDNRAPTLVRSGLKIGESREDKWRQIGFDIRLEAEPVRPEQVRSVDDLPRLTIGVVKRIQGIPDNWNLPPNISTRKASLLIANAFPPVLARAVGLAVREALTGKAHDQNEALQQPVIDTRRIGRKRDPINLKAVIDPRWRERAPSAKAKIWREHIVHQRKEEEVERLLYAQALLIEDHGPGPMFGDET